MKVRKARIPSPEIEALNLYSLLQSPNRAASVFGDDRDRAAFLNLVEQGIAASLKDQRRIHGRWTQDLFAAVAVSLDSIRLIKEEDSGSFYFDHTRAALHLPDFRVVLDDSRQLLVEVKNVAPSGIKRTQKLRASQVEAAEKYARLTGAELYLAHFWAFPSRWTLVNSAVLVDEGEFKTLTPATAFKENEMVLLRDFCIGTQSLGFVLSFVTDPDKPQRVMTEADGTESVSLTFDHDEIYCEGVLLTNEIERRLASTFMIYSGLDMHERVTRNEDGTVKSYDYIFFPFGEGATMHMAPASGILSVRYILATKAEDGSITRIRHEPDSNLGRLIPDEYWALSEHTLVMQKFIQRPLSSSAPIEDSVGG